MISSSSASSNVASIPSAQVSASGAPRFQIPVDAEHAGWTAAAAQEQDGGVSADVRIFLDAQLETGDVLLDLSPGFGFVALSATTAPGGLPTVFVHGIDDERMAQLQDAAVDVGGWLETLDASAMAALAETLDARLDTEGRLFVHLSANVAAETCGALQPLIGASRVLAFCIGDAAQSEDWASVTDALHAVGFTPCMLADVDGEPTVVPLTGTPTAAVIALPTAIVAPAAADDDVFAGVQVESARTVSRFAGVGGWNAQRHGLHLLAPHSRTGYGVTGAHLLRALQETSVPVAFHHIGPLDRSITDNEGLDRALADDVALHADAPSVRLAQQFDLGTHAGRGAAVGFTIFERDLLTPDEVAGMRAQDAIIVCSEWARQVCIANGLSADRTYVVPLGVDRAIFHESVTSQTRSDDTVFMQVGKLEPRKGQHELLAAFEAAFTPDDSVRLVLSCANPFVTPATLDAMLAPFRKSPMASRITVRTAELPSLRDVARVMAMADCGVFAARAEGWNLEALEMLSMGKTVIATDYSAHTAYLNAENARLIGIDALEPAVGGTLPGQWAAWGPSQHEQLVQHLRDVHGQRQAGTLGVNTAGIATARQFSWAASAGSLVSALAKIA